MGNALVNPPAQQYSLEARGDGRFALSGALTLSTASNALVQGDRLFGPVSSVEVDLSGVASADSAGLAVLLEWVRTARRDGRRLALRNLPPPLAAIASISEVEDVLKAAEA